HIRGRHLERDHVRKSIRRTEPCESFERARMRLERDDAARAADQTRKEERLGADAGTDVEDGVSFARRVLVEEAVAPLGREDPRRRRAAQRSARNLRAAGGMSPGTDT